MAKDMARDALSGVRVVELATGIAGPYCGKLLADLGAAVVKIEPPGGDPARAAGPFPGGQPHRERSALFLYNNTSKRGVTLDLARAADRATLERMLAAADVLIDDRSLARLEDLGLDFQTLAERNPGLIHTQVTPYGRTGPRAADPGGELTLTHAGGLGNLLPTRSADTSRAPVKLGGSPMLHSAAVIAALATVAALLERRISGRGQQLDVSVQDVVLALVAPLITGTRYQDTTWSRVPDRPPAMGRLETRDGYVIVNAFDDHHFTAFRELMGNPAWCAAEEWAEMDYRAHHLMEIAPQIEAWLLEQNKDELHHRAAARGIPIGGIENAREVMANKQYEARGYFVEVEHPEAGRHRYAGWPYRLSASPARVSRPAPLLGEHGGELPGILEQWSADRAPAAPSGAPRRLPLAGVRILDFCWVWAGPYAGMLLGSLGAEVIKVEGPGRLDLTRRGVVWPLPEPAPRRLPLNQGLAYNTVNLDKQSLTLDLQQPAGVELARRLAAVSDVVVDNMRPGALDKLGLGYSDLRALRPDIIVASSSGRGRGGPETQYLGFASVHQGIGGGAYLTGYPDDAPCHSGGDVDLMNAMTLAFAIAAALHHRAATGAGQFVDYSQCEGVSSLLGEELLGYALTGEIPERCGNAHPGAAPHNVYRAWGADRWLAIEVHDDEAFAALARVIGRPELAADARFRDAPSRKRNERELDRSLEEWTAQRDRDWMVGELRRAGVTAAPSRDARDLWADRHLRERGAFAQVDHPELGALELVRAPFRMSAHELPARRAPLLGEHTDEVLRRVLGLSDHELDALRNTGAIR